MLKSKKQREIEPDESDVEPEDSGEEVSDNSDDGSGDGSDDGSDDNSDDESNPEGDSDGSDDEPSGSGDDSDSGGGLDDDSEEEKDQEPTAAEGLIYLMRKDGGETFRHSGTRETLKMSRLIARAFEDSNDTSEEKPLMLTTGSCDDLKFIFEYIDNHKDRDEHDPPARPLADDGIPFSDRDAKFFRKWGLLDDECGQTMFNRLGKVMPAVLYMDMNNLTKKLHCLVALTVRKKTLREVKKMAETFTGRKIKVDLPAEREADGAGAHAAE